MAALVPFSGQLAGLPGDMGGHGSAVAGQAFSVRAYASDTRMLVPPTDNGMIVFDRSGSLTTPTKDWYLQYGKYTGCMFTVEGEGIVRIQATTSAGMFYRNSYETINGRDDPERVAEVTAWKPEKAGLGDHYGKYESVQVVDRFWPADPDRDMTVRLTKMLGSTIDLPISADDDGDASFGLWTNEDYGDAVGNRGRPTCGDRCGVRHVRGPNHNGDGLLRGRQLRHANHRAAHGRLQGDDERSDGVLQLRFHRGVSEIVDRSMLPNVLGRRGG
ncbi:MAG: hypothetical protein ACLSVD_02375 [Eggerthellaceae bacterium]